MHPNRHTTLTHTNSSLLKPQYTLDVSLTSQTKENKGVVNVTHICVFKAKKILHFFFSFFHQRPFLDLVGARIMWKDGDPSGQNLNFSPRIPKCWAHRISINSQKIHHNFCGFKVTLCSLCHSKLDLTAVWLWYQWRSWQHITQNKKAISRLLLIWLKY